MLYVSSSIWYFLSFSICATRLLTHSFQQIHYYVQNLEIRHTFVNMLLMRYFCCHHFISDERQDSEISNSSIEEFPASTLLIPSKAKLAPIASCETLSDAPDLLTEMTESESSESADEPGTPSATVAPTRTHITFSTLPPGESSTDPYPSEQEVTLSVPISLSLGTSSSETLTGSLPSPRAISAATSSDTLVPGSPQSTSPSSPVSSSPILAPKKGILLSPRKKYGFRTKKFNPPPIKIPTSSQMDALALSPATSPKFRRAPSPLRRATSPVVIVTSNRVPSPTLTHSTSPTRNKSPLGSPQTKRPPSPISYSFSSPNIISNLGKSRTGNHGCHGYTLFVHVTLIGC